MDLPYEVLVYLFKYLPKSDRKAASETCRSCIEYINFTDCYNLKDDAVKEVVKGLRRLRQLQLRGCNQLTDETLAAIGAHCTKLQFLDVQGCRNMSPELACSIGSLPTLHTVLMSKPGPYIDNGKKNRAPAPAFLPSLMRKLRLH
ncbi:hypothetical protein PYW07_007203 [Mythimna separata]|uniref:Uncharacterized protein n=1 Tax=Mythimna separata TaxID=271217 RepID=A0AAD8E0Y1_MYTSE|nr:hypothetical protein PYW07_007203 [Mythimna separata]